MRLLAILLAAFATLAMAADRLSSIGDARMASLMDAWADALHSKDPTFARGEPWRHPSDATAFGALMFETADIAPIAREPSPAEIAPYAHQFSGDMMKTPLLVKVARLDGKPAYVAVNKRPGSPLPQRVKAFLDFALSDEGQDIVMKAGGFGAITAPERAEERAKLEGFLVSLDPALSSYVAMANVSGPIRSVGSDGMKTLMDRWMRDFNRLQPGVRPGMRWEHLGTLNGFHALITNEADIAPMGRELWPSELAMYEATQHRAAPLEIRVARGGFNTPQRTTAQAIFVQRDNPLGRITVGQLEAILRAKPGITRWGELGLRGEWSDRPIHIYMPPAVAPNATSMQIMVLKGGGWNASAREGSIADTAAAIARDPTSIGFGGFEEGGPGIKALAIARSDAGPYYEGNAENASSGRYPLTRYMYIRLNADASHPVARHIAEFLRYILSREGQEPVRYSGYFPLTADEVKEELAKLR